MSIPQNVINILVSIFDVEDNIRTTKRFKELLNRIECINISSNEYVFHQGDVGDCLYILAKGSVNVIDEAHDMSIISVLHEGSYFGEIAIVNNTYRSAGVYTLADVTVYKVMARDVRSLLESSSKSYGAFLKILYNRLTQGYETLEREHKKVVTISNANINYALFFSGVIFFITFFNILTSIYNVSGLLSPAHLIVNPILCELVVCIFLLAAIMLNKLDISSVGVGNHRLWRSLAESTLMSIFTLLGILIYLFLIPIYPNSNVFSLSRLGISHVLLLITVPIRELIVRGALQNALISTLDNKFTIISVSLPAMLITTLYLPNGIKFAMVYLFINVLCGMMFTKQRNILSVCIFHFCSLFAVFLAGIV